jgi:hypothetical protein
MVNYIEICYCSFTIFIICIIGGLPTFFTGCNLDVTNFCPSYNVFNGYVYQTKITERKCTKGRKRVECWDVYAYASNTLYYNQSTSSCRYKIVDSLTHESQAEKDAQNYYVGKYIRWYKGINTNKCFDSDYVITLWYVGVLFLSLGSCAGLIGCIFLIISSLYKKQKTKYSNLEMNTINLTI